MTESGSVPWVTLPATVSVPERLALVNSFRLFMAKVCSKALFVRYCRFHAPSYAYPNCSCKRDDPPDS